MITKGELMATLTLSIPDELKARLDACPSVNWTEYLKLRFARKLKQLRKLKERGEL